MEREVLKEPVQNWNLMSWQQMIDVANVWYGTEEESTKRLKVLCVLMGWELVGKEYDMPIVDRLLSMTDGEVLEFLKKGLEVRDESGDTKDERRKTKDERRKSRDEWGEMMKECDGVLNSNGRLDILVKDNESGDVLSFDADNLAAAAYKFTEFMDKSSDLRYLPISDLKVGKNVYVFPDMALSNVVFTNFQDIQKYEESVWEGLESVRKILESIDAINTNDEAFIQRKSDEINGILADVKEDKSKMLGCLLQRKKWKGFDFDLSASFPWISIKNKWTYVLDMDRALDDMREAPEWLFNICEMFVQGSVAFYNGQYPKVFKKSGDGKDNKAPLIARTDTIRALMKYQGFGRLEDVKDMLVPEAFSVMNAMSEESEEIEKMKNKKN